MSRHSRWYTAVALVCTLVLLVAVDVCLLVTCAPRAGATARCSHCATPASSTKAPLAGHGADANAPCCVKLTLRTAPTLAAPAATAVDFAPALMAFAASAPAPATAGFEPPRDEAPPPTREGLTPRAERGPPSC